MRSEDIFWLCVLPVAVTMGIIYALVGKPWGVIQAGAALALLIAKVYQLKQK